MSYATAKNKYQCKDIAHTFSYTVDLDCVTFGAKSVVS
jgi:hypothetical protein